MGNKFLLALASIFFLGITSGFSQLGCPDVTVPDTTVCGGGCFPITATPVSGLTTTDYTVNQIAYTPYPFVGANQVIINTDDIWTPTIGLPFNFCFYGNGYSSMTIGSNGLISFDVGTYAGGFCQWSIGNPIPSTQNPMNSIMAPYHDIDPSISTANRRVSWQLLGAAPCRVMVITWYDIALFNCNNLIVTQQIALYETTNIIETYIANKPLCTSWQSGAAIHGIQNGNGTVAHVVPGRNYPTQWTATNDAWAFVPNGTPNYQVYWYEQGNTTPIDSGLTTTLCPTTTTNYIAEVIYNNCGIGTVTVYDTATVLFQNTPLTLSLSSTDVTCFGDSNGTATVVASNGVTPYTYDWNTSPSQNTPTATNLTGGTYTIVVVDSIGCSAEDSVTIVEPPLVTLSATSQDPPCFGQNGSASVSGFGGVGGFTYSWNTTPPTTTQSASLPAGNWTGTVTDGNGCTADTTLTITQPTLLTANASSTAVLCNGGSDGTATVNAGGGTPPYTYFWAPGGQTTAQATGLAGGSYTVTVTDSLGCTATATTTVNEPTALSSSITSTPTSCFGGADGTATVTVSGGSPAYSYFWNTSPVQTASTAINLTAGTYTCVIFDANSCSDTLTVTVNEPPQLGVTMAGTNETCLGFNDGSAFATVTGGTNPFTYSWSNGSSGSSVAGLGSGTYTVTVTDGNGCSNTGSVTIGAAPSPIADAGADISACFGEGGDTLTGSGSGGTAPYYYTWSCATPPCGLSSPFNQSTNANPTSTMTYYLQVTDANGCPSALDSVTVTILPKPIVNAGPDLYICAQPAPGAQINATVTNSPGPYTYQWTPAAGLNNPNLLSPYARPDTTTIYTLVVTDQTTGCTSQATTVDTLSTVTVHVAPQPIANGGPDRSICEGESIQMQGYGFGAGPAYTFQWSPSASLSNPTIPNPIASPSLTTEYVLTVWSNGCPSIGDTVTVNVNTNPTIDAGPDRDRCWGDAAMLDGQAGGVIGGSNFQFNWTPGLSLSDSTAEDPIASPLVTTMYYLTAVSDSGCVSPTDSVLFTVRPTPIAEAGPPVNFCLNSGEIILGGTYSWENGNAPNDLSAVNVKWEPAAYVVGNNDQDTVTVNPPSSTWFYYTVTYDSCFHTDSMLVTVFPEIFATADADTSVICGGDSVMLTATGGIGGASYQWIPQAGIGNPTSPTTMAAPVVSTLYQVVVSEAGCTDTAEVNVDVIPTPVVDYISSLPQGCAPFTVHFMETSQDDYNWVWDFGDGTPTVNNPNPVHTFDQPGTYVVTLTAVGPGGCAATNSDVTVTVIDQQQADFTSNPEFPVEMIQQNTTVQFFDASDNSVKWYWEFGNGESSEMTNPSHTYRDQGEYYVTLTVTNEFGCISEVTHGPYIVLAPDLFIPNVFSPNDDGVNDKFLVEYTGDQHFNLKVFDRWGNVVYDSKNKMEGWNGLTIEGQSAPEGVYYYTLIIGNKEYNGNITLMK